jgi:aminopeptidase-like protein
VDAVQRQERMRALIDRHYRLNRVAVGDDTSRLVRELADELQVPVQSIPTGTPCLTWTVPRKWVVREAFIETLEGKRIADFHWNPLYLHSYSVPFSGIVTHRELMEHITVHPVWEDRLIYHNRWQYHLEQTQWAFSVPASVAGQMTDDMYRVLIDASFEDGTLDLIDWILPGESPETVFFAAHTCHPGQVNDGLACIAVLVELFRSLQALPKRRYTYRLILGPEYYAAAAVLAYGKQVKDLRYGFCLDMMANLLPVSFSRSFQGNSYVDRVTRSALRNYEAGRLDSPYRSLYGNDEMFYDGPGFEIPTVCLSRHPYPYYHTDWDDLEHCDFGALEESYRLLMDIADRFETDVVPVRHFEGPLHLSRYNLYLDPRSDPKGYSALQEIQIYMDGKRSLLDIAEKTDVSFEFVRNFVGGLVKHGLASIRKTGIPEEVLS